MHIEQLERRRGAPTDVVARVRETLRRAGYLHLRGLGARAELLELADRLGTPLEHGDVRPIADAPTSYMSHEALPLHNDSALAEIVAWVCLEPPAEEGETLLLHRDVVCNALGPVRLAVLEGVTLPCPDRTGRWSIGRPIVQRSRDGIRFYFAEWLCARVWKSLSSDQRDAVAELITTLREAREELVEISWARGDCLLIDNGVWFHGRRSFRSDRHLVRVWIADVQWCDA